MKPADSLAVKLALSEVLGDIKKVSDYVEVYKEKDKKTALIKPHKWMPVLVWRLIQNKVKELGGHWSKKQRLWEVPLT